MKDRIFIDSNIILYSFMEASDKSAVARKILSEENCIISSQVVGEVCNNLRKKSGYTAEELKHVINGFYSEFSIIPVSSEIYLKAVNILQNYSISFWDSVIIAAAIESGCGVLYSEDMQHGLSIDSMRIVNPFAII